MRPGNRYDRSNRQNRKNGCNACKQSHAKGFRDAHLRRAFSVIVRFFPASRLFSQFTGRYLTLMTGRGR